MEIKIKYFNEDYERLQKFQKGDWIDLRADKDITLHANEEALIPLGIAMELPAGYEAHIAPRSSTFKKWGIIQVNSVGVVDNTYCGDNDQWFMGVICLAPRSYDENGVPATIIKRGDRIAQFRIMENQPSFDMIEVKELGNADRGATALK